ncbi:MAG: NUDIX domain-containing protein [Acholeplasmataceae bacterium]|nr:NUDIX domain-containing protein [Acholeplasmataceae bacterium]
MKSLGPIIIEEGIVQKPDKFRTTVRAVIIDDDHQVLMVYSKLYDDYTFPGGGLKEDEDKIKALKRELREELGARKITILQNLGSIEEVKYGLFDKSSIYLQTSIYYVVKIESTGKQKLEYREKMHGIKPTWKHIDFVIEHNKRVMYDENHQAYGLKTVLVREQIVLEKIKELNL